MDLEGIMLSEISQTEKDKCHMISRLYVESFLCVESLFVSKINEQTKQKQTHREHRENKLMFIRWEGVGRQVKK